MSYSPTSYIDGVPVKISEKYKPPPKISLPQKIVQCITHCGSTNLCDLLPYNFELEENTQIFLSSWKNQRQQDRFARKDRVQHRQIERQRQQDEYEKRMLTAVTYPSAEDLSSDDEREEKVESKPRPSDSTASLPNASFVLQTHPRFDTILLPTIMPGPPKVNSSWSFASNIDGAATLKHTETTSLYSSSAPQPAMGKINWSDFETDTSNPFDNVELKSINDLDILAQVLKQNYISAATVPTDAVGSTNNQSHSHIIDSNQSPANHTNEAGPPMNANVLNSNDVLQAEITHSIGTYNTVSPSLYASHSAHSNQIHGQQPIDAQQHQANYFNYKNHSLNNSSATDNYANNCNQKYTATYGPFVPFGHSFIVGQVDASQPVTAGMALATPSVMANSVPDILQQITSSTGHALK